MSGTVRLVTPGASAQALLADAISATGRRGSLAPVTLVAPSGATRQRLRAALARVTGGIANVRVVLLSELAGELAQDSPVAPLPRASRLVVRTICAGVLRAVPGYLAPVARHHATADELAFTYETVRFAPAGALERLGALGGRRSELAGLLGEVRAVLAERFVDDVDVFEAARAALSPRRAEALGTVIVVQPARLRDVEVALLGRLAEVGELEVLLAAPGRSPGTGLALAETLAGVGLTQRDDRSSQLGKPPEVLEANDERAEVRAAFEIVLDELARGSPPEELALLVSADEPYLGLISRLATELGIAISAPALQRLEDLPAARSLAGFLEVARLGTERRRVVSWLGSAPLGGALGEALGLGDWDRVTRAAAIGNEEPAQWRSRLQRHIARLERDLDQLEHDEAGARRRARVALELDRARRALDGLVPLFALIARAGAIASWSDGVECCRAMLGAVVADGTDPLGVNGPVLAVLDELEALGRVGAASSLERFSEALGAALARIGPPTGSTSAGLLVGRLEAASGLFFRRVVVLGANERRLPMPERESPLLDLDAAAAIGVDGAGATVHLQREAHRFEQACASAASATVLVARAELATGRRLLRSRLVEVATRSVGSGPSVLSVAELEASLLAAANDPAAHFLCAADPELARLVGVARSRGQYRYDEFSGAVRAAGLLEGFAAASFSPTTLEHYATCPAKYFYDKELTVEVIDSPEERVRIDAAERGSLVHKILERFVTELLEGPVGDEDAERSRLVAIAEEEFAALEAAGLVGKAVLWAPERRRLLRLIESERARDRARRLGGLVPLAVELHFGEDDAEPVTVALARTQLRFHGMIDRLDRTASGGLSVVDYKTGASGPYAGLKHDPVDGGRHLQLLVYALAALAQGDRFGGGEIEAATFRLLDDNGREFGAAPDAASLKWFREVLEVLTGAIAQGQFPVNPGPDGFYGPHNCGRCDFNRVCRADRSALAVSLAGESTLAGYFALADGPGTVADAADDGAVDDVAVDDVAADDG